LCTNYEFEYIFPCEPCYGAFNYTHKDNFDSTNVTWSYMKQKLFISQHHVRYQTNFSWLWDRWHWKGYLLIFPCICRSPKSEVGHVLPVNLEARWSWTLSWTWSQTPSFWIGLNIQFVVHVSLALQHPLDVPHVLHDPLIDS
jgi:hypothetical protein